MKSMKLVTTLVLAATLSTGTAIADSHLNQALGARQSLMTLYSFNLGALGGMAQGKIDYDAAAAQKAADNLVALSSVDQSAMWLAGSDNGALGNVTRAKPELWGNFPDVIAKIAALNAAAKVMSGAAGGGLDQLRGAIGGVGQACGACHKAYRAPRE